MKLLRLLPLGIAAHCLLAAVIGFPVSMLAIAWPDEPFGVELGEFGLHLSCFLLVVGMIVLAIEVCFTSPAERPFLWPQFLRWGIVAGIMVIPTAILFGNWSGFHHMIGFGPLPPLVCYMFWNGEDPDPKSFQIVRGYEVWFYPITFAALTALWLTILAVVAKGIVGSELREKPEIGG